MFKQRSGVLRRQWAPLPLRLVIGFNFVVSGLAKLNRGLAKFTELPNQINAILPEMTA